VNLCKKGQGFAWQESGVDGIGSYPVGRFPCYLQIGLKVLRVGGWDSTLALVEDNVEKYIFLLRMDLRSKRVRTMPLINPHQMEIDVHALQT
jgi:hypothetical protein